MKKLTSKQAADYIQVSESTLKEWRRIKKHKIPYVQHGKHGRVLYSMEDLDKFIKQCEVRFP